MKKKKFNIFEKLIFTILFGISSICLLGAWSIDDNGNLQSDNLFDKDNAVDGDINSNGLLNPNNTSWWTSDYIKVEPNTTYAFSGADNYIFYYESNKNWISREYGLSNYTTPSKCYYVRINGLKSTQPKENVMFNEGNTTKPYEPYGIWYSQENYNELQYEISRLNTEIAVLEDQKADLEIKLEDLQNEYDTLLNNIGTISFDKSQYSVSVGSVPNIPSFIYTKQQDLSNNFSNIGYLNVSDIYTNYIQNGNNNSIYITTPQSNLLTFDMTLNFTTQPNTSIKTTLTLPNGDLQQFLYSASDFNYKGEWTLANLVASSAIGTNYDINDISYKDVIITYENVGNNLSDIKLGSNNGYNTGFNSGYNTSLNKINELQNKLNTKTSLLEKATIDLQNKTNEYNMLLARYQQVTETPLQLNFQNLIWTIASSPFESFKQIWNVDILGFNIANFVIGVMSVFVVMYIIKKIF